jgi:hypothetical protein
VCVPACSLKVAQPSLCFGAGEVARAVGSREQDAIVAEELQLPLAAPPSKHRIDVIVPTPHAPQAIGLIYPNRVISHAINHGLRYVTGT